MDEIGLIEEHVAQFLNVLDDNYQAHLIRAESREELYCRKSMEQRYDFVKSVAKQNNLMLFMIIEKIILHDDLSRYANSPEGVNSIKTAIKHLDEALKAIGIVEDKEKYQNLNIAMSSKNKEAGLPLDAFRVFIKSHTARLTNRLSSSLSTPEKNVLRQRKKNIKKAKELYIDLQCKALGLGVSKDEGIER